MAAMSWRDEAACLDAPVEWFFGMPYSKGLQVCNGCPVTDECLRFAVGLRRANGHLVRGVWGGQVFSQRQP